MEKERIEHMTREEKRFARINEELAEAAQWLVKPDNKQKKKK
jgi:hypothetical protein